MAKLHQFGIRSKLFLAFAVVSGTTVIAGVAGWLMFSQVGELFHDVAGKNIPEIVGNARPADRKPRRWPPARRRCWRCRPRPAASRSSPR